MLRIADGDRSAFSAVYKTLWPVLRAFVARQLQPSDSEDVAQEALLKVLGRASDFDPEREALTWALGTAAVEVLGTLRPSDIETLQSVLSGRSPPIHRATFRKRVERALKRLRLAWR